MRGPRNSGRQQVAIPCRNGPVMKFDAQFLLDRLLEFETIAGKPKRFLVAYSGGVDSTVLLHALATGQKQHGVPVIAVHVDHGLHPESAQWDRQCQSIASGLGIEYLSRCALVSRDSGLGLEAAAREARYAVLGSLVQTKDWLLSAHHENDQAETLLLNLLRGSGLSGLAAMADIREFSAGFLVRPLLGISGEAVVRYAQEHGLDWSEDPSNRDTAFDRNYLRREIMPRLAVRWPAVITRLRQSAELAAESSELLADLAGIDIGGSPSVDRLDIRDLRKLSRKRQRNAIRHAVRRLGLPAPPATRLYQAVHELIPARQDAQPLVTWPGGEMRRHRNHLYILATLHDPGPEPLGVLLPDVPLELGCGLGCLLLEPAKTVGIDRLIAAQGLEVRFRSGGEEITLPGESHSRKLKKLLQEHAVVPWMRERLPLLYANDRLVAVADLWLEAQFVASDGYAPRWVDRPALY